MNVLYSININSVLNGRKCADASLARKSISSGDSVSGGVLLYVASSSVLGLPVYAIFRVLFVTPNQVVSKNSFNKSKSCDLRYMYTCNVAEYIAAVNMCNAVCRALVPNLARKSLGKSQYIC